MTDLTALEALLAKMMPGPWIANCDYIDNRDGFIASCGTSEDAAGVVALVNAAPKLIAELKRWRLMASTLDAWTHLFGAALCPTAGSADTFGDGIRAAKKQVSAMIHRPFLRVVPAPDRGGES